MSIATHIKTSMVAPESVVKAFLQDLSDQDLLLRPAPNANHIAWQLGHLISSEHQLVNMICPDAMPALPDGFAEKYTKQTAGVDDPAAFETKQRYLELLDEQRAGALAALEKLSDEELEKPAPEPIQMLGATVGAIFTGLSMHSLMHAGQWTIVRRQKGIGPMF